MKAATSMICIFLSAKNHPSKATARINNLFNAANLLLNSSVYDVAMVVWLFIFHVANYIFPQLKGHPFLVRHGTSIVYGIIATHL